MSTKEKRARLFKRGKPLVREFVIKDDMWVLWAAYDMGSFKKMKAGMTKAEFRDLVLSVCRCKSSCLMIEDDCRYFKSGRGPVGFVTLDNYGWRIEPQVDFFRWATPRMILRANVAFFQMVRYSKDVGVCIVRSLKRTVNLFHRVQRYGLLLEIGTIPNGSAEGDETLFSIRGLKEAR